MNCLKLFLLTLFIILTACSENNYNVTITKTGTEIISNHKAKYDSCRIKLNNLVKINLKENGIEDYISTESIKTDGNSIFLALKNHIYLFSKDGLLLTKKNIEGKGPGEIASIGSLFRYNNRLYISCVDRKIVNEYDFNSLEFIREIPVKRNYSYTVSDSLIVGYYNFSSLQQGTGFRKISVLNNDLEESKTLYEDEMKFNYKNSDPISYNQFLVNTSGDYVYYYTPDKNSFTINGLGINSKNRIIKKNYRKSSLPESMVKELNEMNKSMGLSYKVDYNYSIENIKIDKYGNLWVREWSSMTDGKNINRYHIFDKNGVYKSFLNIDIDKKYYDVVLDGDKIIFVSIDELVVYDYELDYL